MSSRTTATPIGVRAVGVAVLLAAAGCTGHSGSTPSAAGSRPAAGPVVQLRESATLPDGRPVTRAALDNTVRIISARLHTAGIEAQVQSQADAVVVTGPARDRQLITQLTEQIGALAFRQVLEVADGQGSDQAAGPRRTPVAGAASADIGVVARVFSRYDCGQGLAPAGRAVAAGDYIVACSNDGTEKFLLAPAGVTGQDVKGAAADVEPQTNEWLVQIDFDFRGAQDWLALTKKAYETNAEVPTCVPPVGCNAVSIVLDGVVQSFPRIQQDGIPGGQTQLTGNFTAASAKAFAVELRYGALPVLLTRQSLTTTPA